ncbi:NADPH oxidase 5 [Nymphon striatum]|nr:NADPH oxidase 5 [Nymphon striatum]KAG1714346.1 NADPH oxidase 5 [Nymphon striatum]
MRASGLSSYFPLDDSIYFHKIAGCFIFAYSLLHSIMHVWNFETSTIIALVEDGSYSLYEYLFTTNPGIGWIHGSTCLVGWPLLVVLTVMVIAAHPYVRRTSFWKWFLAPFIIYVIESLIQFRQYYTRRGETYISQAALLASKEIGPILIELPKGIPIRILIGSNRIPIEFPIVTHLVIRRSPDFNFQPGDYIFLNIPSIAKFEWHPFTISSAPEMEGYISLHIRGVGQWTNTLYEYFSNIPTQKPNRISKNLNKFRMSYRSNDVSIPINELNNKTDLTNKAVTTKSIKNSIQNFCDNRDGEVIIDVTKIASVVRDHAELDDNKIQDVKNDFQEVKLRNEVNNTLIRTQSDTTFGNNVTSRNVNFLRSSTDTCYSKVVLDASKSLAFYASNLRESGFCYLRKKPNIISVPVIEEIIKEEEPTQQQTSDQQQQSTENQCSTNASAISETNSKNGIAEPTQIWPRPVPVYIMGPYGSPSSQIFRAEHAVLIATGIGVTPFASILQSIMHRYREARVNCPKCDHCWVDKVPPSVMNLKKASNACVIYFQVDFFWINRDQRAFEWFLKLLSQLEIEQAELDGVNHEHFLDLHMYITSALEKSDVKAVFLQMALELMHQKEQRDRITGLKTRTKPGRPDWDKVLKEIAQRKKGKVTVFFCGSPQLGRVLRLKCNKLGFKFKKEKF